MQDEPDDAPWLPCARVALLRGGLVGLALVLPGLVVQACFSPVTTTLLLGEAAFDLSIGVFVVAPAAFVEGLSALPPHPPLERRVGVALAGALAFLGAIAAFLQSLYATAVLRTGSLDEGFREITRGAGLVVVLEDLLGLFGCIALVVATFTMSWPSGAALARCVVVAAVASPLVLAASGLRGPPLATSIVMLVALAVALPLLAPVADRLALHRRGGDDDGR